MNNHSSKSRQLISIYLLFSMIMSFNLYANPGEHGGTEIGNDVGSLTDFNIDNNFPGTDSFGDIDGLDIETQPIDYRNGLEDEKVRKLPDASKNPDLSTKREKSKTKEPVKKIAVDHAASKVQEAKESSLSDQAKKALGDLTETLKGATEGLGYLTGFKGDASDQAAARKASVKDVTEGKSGSRALGAADSYIKSLTFGLVDPGLSQYATDVDAATAGKSYGTAGAVGVALITGKAGAKAVLKAGQTGAARIGQFFGSILRSIR